MTNKTTQELIDDCNAEISENNDFILALNNNSTALDEATNSYNDQILQWESQKESNNLKISNFQSRNDSLNQIISTYLSA